MQKVRRIGSFWWEILVPVFFSVRYVWIIQDEHKKKVCFDLLCEVCVCVYIYMYITYIKYIYLHIYASNNPAPPRAVLLVI